MDYAMEASYANFVIESHINKIKMEAYIQECMVIAEGTNVVPRIRAIHEDVGDKIKEGWNKFTAFIQRIWAKFVENMTRLFNTDHGYLEKYKDIILGKKLKEDITFTMREYNIGLQRIASKPVPIFASNLLGDINDKDTADTNFKKKLISDYDGKTEWADYCKTYFQGGPDEKDFGTHEINMTDIYNFCRDKNKIYGNIEKDQKTLLNSTNQAEKELTDLINKSKTAQTTPPTTPAQSTNNAGATQQQQNTGTQQTTQNNGQTQQNTNTQTPNESAYSDVLGTVITELTVNKPGSSSTNKNSVANTNTANSGSNTSSLKANSSNNIDKSNVANSAEDKANTANMQIEELKAKIGIYQSDCSTLLTAKMTATDIIFKDYMQIIKTHVSSYAGTDNSADNVMAKAGTDYAAEHKLPELTDAQKNEVYQILDNAENEKDQDKKKDMQVDAINKAKSYSKNFAGDYNAVKQWSNWASKDERDKRQQAAQAQAAQQAAQQQQNQPAK